MEMTRPRNDTEKDLKSGGFLDIRHWRQDDYKQKAIAQIDESYNKFVYVKREPYSTKAALEFLEEKVHEIEQKIKKARDNKEGKLTINLDINWDKFGGLDKFDFLKEEEVVETHIIAGARQPIGTGISKEYKCKKTGSNCAMYFSYKELEGNKKDAGNSNTKQLPKTQNPLA